MTTQEKFEYWLELALYDFDTAKAMLESNRWLYVIFMCQQAIEKLVKGLYVLYVDDNVPRSHNVRFLVEKIESQMTEPVSDKHFDLFDELSLHYISGRYVDYKHKLSEKLNKQAAIDIYEQTKEALAWLLTLKP